MEGIPNTSAELLAALQTRTEKFNATHRCAGLVGGGLAVEKTLHDAQAASAAAPDDEALRDKVIMLSLSLEVLYELLTEYRITMAAEAGIEVPKCQ